MRFVSLCATVVAQQGTGAIAGVIVDPNDKPITGYTGGYITMRNAATGMESQADVKLDGTFELTGLAPGTYEFAAPITGAMYRPYRQSNVTIAAGETLRMRVRIEWGINLGTFGDDPTVLAKDMARSGESMSGPPPRTRDGKPDLSGVWVPSTAGGGGGPEGEGLGSLGCQG